MLWWICDGQVVSKAIAGIGCPANFVEVEGVEGSIDAVYFDSDTVVLKPPKPRDLHTWNASTNQWDDLTLSNIPASEDWAALLNSLQNTPVFGRVYGISTQSLRANSAYTLLLSAITSSHNLQHLEWSIAELREEMDNQAIGNFTSEEIDWINSTLEQCQFELRLNL